MIVSQLMLDVEYLCVSVQQTSKLTRSITSVASGVLLVFGGISLSRGRKCRDCDRMFLIKVKLKK